MKRIALLAISASILSANVVFAEDVAVDLTKSKLTWEGRKIAGQHVGDVPLKSGSVTVTDGQVVAGTFEVDLTKINGTDVTGEDKGKLEGHLKSPDFFEVEKFPVATVKVLKVEKLPTGLSRIVADLTIKGQTKPVSFEAKIENMDGVLHATGETIIDRTNWGVKYHSGRFFDLAALGDKLIKDEIKVGLDLYTAKKAQ